MGTARLFNAVIKRELNVHAAWLPVTNTFQPGDFGLISDGVLVKAGNIADLGVAFADEPGPPSRLNFASEGTRVIRTVGGAEVDALPDGDLEAKLTIEFERESSFLTKANVAVRQITSLHEVASKLAQVTGWNWRRRFRIVSVVYSGERCVILSSKAANSKFELTGKASALKQLEVGAASAEIRVSSSERIGLEIVGESGVIGLALFKLGWVAGGFAVLGPPDKVPIETHEHWPEDLDDDV